MARERLIWVMAALGVVACGPGRVGGGEGGGDEQGGVDGDPSEEGTPTEEDSAGGTTSTEGGTTSTEGGTTSTEGGTTSTEGGTTTDTTESDGDGETASPPPCEPDFGEPNDSPESAFELPNMMQDGNFFFVNDNELTLCPGDEDWLLIAPWEPSDLGVPYQTFFETSDLSYPWDLGGISLDVYDAVTLEPLGGEYHESGHLELGLYLYELPYTGLLLHIQSDESYGYSYGVYFEVGNDLWEDEVEGPWKTP